MSEAPVFANGAYTAAFQHLFNAEAKAHFENKAFRKAMIGAGEKLLAQDQKVEHGMLIGVNKDGEYGHGSIVSSATDKSISLDLILGGSILPEGYTAVGIMHSHPPSASGTHLPIYYNSSVKRDLKMTYMSPSDLATGFKSKLIFGVAKSANRYEKAQIEYGYYNNGTQWNPSNYGKYKDRHSYFYGNYNNTIITR